MKHHLSRRTVLRGVGGVSIALPFLESMRPARAARSAPPKRFVVFFSGNGTIHEAWRPKGTETAFSFVAPPDAPGGKHILAPLERWKSNLVVLDGMAVPTRRMGPGANGHDKGMGHMLTGALLKVGPSGIGDFSHLPDGSAGGASIDQAVAARLAGSTALSSLELGVIARLDRKRQLTSRMCYRGPFQVVPPESDPAEAFRALFAGHEGGAETLAQLRRERRSVLDRVLGDFHALSNELGADDRKKLDAHVSAIRELERAMVRPVDGPQCKVPEQAGATIDPWDNDSFPTLGKLQMDLLVAALACDVTRVASLQWSTGQSPVRFSWLGLSGDSHHGLSHLADDSKDVRAQLVEINHWYAQQFAYLLGRMAEVKEGDGTLLDHSLVMWVNEQGNGDTHSELEVPYVLAGRCGGALRTGRYLKYKEAPVNDLYVSLAKLMGVHEIVSFGHAEVCRGPLPGLA